MLAEPMSATRYITANTRAAQRLRALGHSRPAAVIYERSHLQSQSATIAAMIAERGTKSSASAASNAFW